ncbi:MAG: MDR family MFS transporter [Candidatus Binatia bacterium]
MKSSQRLSDRSLAVAGVMLVILLFAIDATIVSTAMPTVVGKLGGLELYSWVFSSYMLTSALATPLCGKLSDLYGRRRLMLIGIGLFMLASALCGLARSMEQLIVFRALQGIGGGAIYALSFIIVGFLFPPEQRAKIQGLMSGIWGIASILGPIGGGIITEYWNWRWIFFVNVPVSLVAMFLITGGFDESRLEERRKADLKGGAALTLGLFLLFYALEESRRRSFALDLFLAGLLIAATAALLLFVRIERRAEEPILPLDLFHLRFFRISSALAGISSIGMFGVVAYLPLYVQGVLGGSAARAGLVLLLASLGWTAGSLIAGKAISRLGYRTSCIAGMALMASGYALFISAERLLGMTVVLAIGALIGMGMGIVSITSMVAAQNEAPLSRLGVATSTVMLCRMIGGAFGISLMGGVLVSQMLRRLQSLSIKTGETVSDGLAQRLADPQALLDPSSRASIPESLLAPLVDILGRSIWHAFLTGFVVMLLGLGLSFLMARRAAGQAENRG